MMCARNLFANIIPLTTSSSSLISYILVGILIVEMLIVLYLNTHIHTYIYINICSPSHTIILNKHAYSLCALAFNIITDACCPLGIYVQHERRLLIFFLCYVLCQMMIVLLAFCPRPSLGRSSQPRLIKYLFFLSVFVSLSMSIHPSICIPHGVCKLDTCSRGGEKKRILFCASSTTSVFFFSCMCVTLSFAGSFSSSSHCRQDGRVRSRQRRLFSSLRLIVVDVVDSLFPMRRALLLSIVGHYIHKLIENDQNMFVVHAHTCCRVVLR